MPDQLNEAGQVSGYSYRYNGGSTDLGHSAWLYDGATTIDIGLTGSEHTRNDGYKYSYRRPTERGGAGQRVLLSLQRRQHRFGPQCLALRRRDHDRHRPHRQRTHPQRRLQIQRCLQPTERGGAGHRVFRSLQRRQHRFGPQCLALRRRDHDRHRPHRAPNTPATTATNTAIADATERGGAGHRVLRSLQRRQHRFGPKCLALRRHDHDRHRPHGQRAHPQRRLQIQRCRPTERGGAGQRVSPIATTAAAPNWARMPGSTTRCSTKPSRCNFPRAAMVMLTAPRRTWVKTAWS